MEGARKETQAMISAQRRRFSIVGLLPWGQEGQGLCRFVGFGRLGPFYSDGY